MSLEALDGLGQGLRRLGGAVTGGIAWVGYAARFFVAILWHSPGAFRRLHLTLRRFTFPASCRWSLS
jgi:hypothetical protein